MERLNGSPLCEVDGRNCLFDKTPSTDHSAGLVMTAVDFPHLQFRLARSLRAVGCPNKIRRFFSLQAFTGSLIGGLFSHITIPNFGSPGGGKGPA